MTRGRLPLRPSAWRDESAGGYIRRLATANHVGDAAALIRLANSLRQENELYSIAGYVSEQHGKMHSLLGHTADEVLHRGASVLKSMRYTRGTCAACCPDCLEEQAYWRVGWEQLFVVYCDRHDLLLLDRCEVCGRRLSPWGVPLGRCNCGHKFKAKHEHRSPPLSASAKTCSAMIDHQCGGLTRIELSGVAAGVSPEVSALNAEDLQMAIHVLGSSAVFQDTRAPLKNDAWTNPTVRLQVLGAGADILVNWPHEYYHFLSRLSRDGKELAVAYGNLYRLLYRGFLGEQFNFLRRAFEEYIAENWQGRVCGRHRCGSAWLQESQRYIPGSQVKKIFGTRLDKLSNWIESGQLRGTVSPLPSGRRQVLVARDDLYRIQALCATTTLREASTRLHLPEGRVLEIVSAGILHAEKPVKGAQWQFRARDIDRFLADLKEQAVLVDAASTKPLPWLLKYCLHKHMTVESVLMALKSGGLPYAWQEDKHEQGLAAIRICRLRFKEWQQPNDGSFTVPQVANVLNIKQEIAYALVRSGLLRACRQGRGSRVAAEDLAEFRRTYVFASDIASRLGSSPRAVMNRLTSVGVELIEIPEMCSRRQALYKRQDIATSPAKSMLC